MLLSEIRKLNPDIAIYSVNDAEFSKYGKTFPKGQFADIIELIDRYTNIPDEGNVYVADDPRLHIESEDRYISGTLYGEMPIQIGYCNGVIHALNGFEYHQCNELTLPVTDCILMLAQQSDIINNQIDASHAKCFYLEAGQAISLYPTSLHYSPAAVTESGFKVGIILLLGTNAPLELNDGNDPTLRMKNKWLLVHADAPAAKKGAFVGVTGDNIVISIVKGLNPEN